MEKAFLVCVTLSEDSYLDVGEQLEELRLLAQTAGAKTVSTSYQKRHKPDPATFIGNGKAEQIINQSRALDCNLIIFNNDVGPNQIKNLQKLAGNKIKIIDRTGIILDIFIKHAKTKEAKTQVKLAQLEYLLPRLTRQWTHLERQMGGVGTRGGPGETQIEIDRRLIRNKINYLKKDLAKINKQRNTQNLNRNNTFRIALIGYTNSGKSTLMNALTDAKVLIEDKLFATLDTTTRKFNIDNIISPSILISDTVGFIRNIPHHLVASFQSTLSEVNDVQLIIKVFDINTKILEEHIEIVDNVLNSITSEIKPFLLVFNKIDTLKDDSIIQKMKKKYNDAIFISATKKEGLNKIKDNISDIIKSNYIRTNINVDYNQTKILKDIYELTTVLKKVSNFKNITFTVEGNKANINRIKMNLKNE